jgi:hypothetical protein
MPRPPGRRQRILDPAPAVRVPSKLLRPLAEYERVVGGGWS